MMARDDAKRPKKARVGEDAQKEISIDASHSPPIYRGSECDSQRSHKQVKYRESGPHRVITECDIHGTLAACKASTLVGKGTFSIAGLAAQVASSLDPTRTKCGQSCSGTRT
jgi:hypothetical protein